MVQSEAEPLVVGAATPIIATLCWQSAESQGYGADHVLFAALMTTLLPPRSARKYYPAAAFDRMQCPVAETIQEIKQVLHEYTMRKLKEPGINNRVKVKDRVVILCSREVISVIFCAPSVYLMQTVFF